MKKETFYNSLTAIGFALILIGILLIILEAKP